MYNPVTLELYNFLSYKKEIFNFPTFGANVITGLNEDNPSQKVNGAGKSSLQEGVGFAYLGSSLRDVTAKGLIRRGEKKSIVILKHYNSLTKKYFTIYRELSSKSSAICKLYLSEDEELVEQNEIRLSDVNEYNKKIFEILQISKEDLVKFYLLTSKYYKPFFNISDNDKKEIVNRFSQTSSIDLDVLENEIKPIDEEISSLDLKKEKIEGKLIVQNENISLLKSKDISEEKKVLKEEIEKKYLKYEDEILLIKEKIEDFQKDVKVLDKSIKDLNVDVIKKEIKEELDKIEKDSNESKEDIDILKESILDSKNAVEVIEKDQESDSKSFDQKIANLEKELRDKKATIDEKVKKIRESIKSNETQLSSIEKKMLDNITCPLCKGVFNLKSPDFNIEEGKKSISDLKQSISKEKEEETSQEEKRTELSTLNQRDEDKILEEKRKSRALYDERIEKVKIELKEDESILNSIEEELEKNRKKYRELKNKSTLLDNDLEELKNKKQSILKKIKLEEDSKQDLLTKINNKENELKEIQNLSYVKEIKEIEEKIKLDQDEKSSIEKEIEDWKVQKEDRSKWIQIIVGFKSYIANKSLKTIEDYTNYFLREMGTDLSIEIGGYKTLADGKTLREKITTEVLRDGVSVGSYGSFSAGERGRIDMAIVLVFQELINSECSDGGLNLLMIDEVFDSVEPLGLELIVNSLKDTSKKVLIVSQNEINALKSRTITAVKRNGITKLEY